MLIFKRLYNAYFFSLNGLKYAIRTQWALRTELYVLTIALPCTYYLGETPAEYVLLISSILLLPIVELLNTAIETTVNRISYEQHELSGLAKDLGSSAIFVTVINALVTWGIIFFSKIF